MTDRSPPSLATLVILTALSVLALNMFLPSLSGIAAEFQADYALVSLSIGGFLAVSAVLQIIMGPLSDLYGRRPVMLGGMALFTVASLGCLLAQDVWSFMIFRMLQSGAVVGMVLSRAVVRDTVPQAEAARRLGLIGSAMALAPLLGPLIGGVLDEFFGWRANFVAYTLIGLAVLVLIWADLGETNRMRGAGFRAHFRSYPELGRSGLFWAHCICLVFSVGGFYAFIGAAPQVGEARYGLSPAWVGLGMGCISLGFLAGNLLSTWLPRFVPLSRVIVAGRVMACVGPLVGLALLAVTPWDSPLMFFAPVMLVGLGNGLTLPGVNAGVMSVAPHLAGSASGLSGALTVAAGALITAAAGVAAGSTGRTDLSLALILATSVISLAAAVAAARIEARKT